MLERLPHALDVSRLADRGAVLRGRLPIARMRRLIGLLGSSSAGVDVDLTFGVDKEGHINVRGRVQTELVLTCQRCLQPMTLPLTAVVSLAAVADERQAAYLPERYEPLVLASQAVGLSELVEDEVLLALPQVPLHPAGLCRAPESSAVTPEDDYDNPFAVLARLKASPDL